MPSIFLTLTPAGWYLVTVAMFVVPTGIQTVLFPWLVTIKLELGATELGLGQMALQLPLFLILIGGFLADRFDAKRMLMGLHVLAALPPLGLAVLIASGQLSFFWMLVFALVTGTINAFAQPARDKLLSSVASTEIQKTVTITMGLTFGAQVIGYAAASFADSVGAVALLILMTCLLMLGFGTSYFLPNAKVEEQPSPGSGMGEAIKDGLRIVLESEPMRASALLLASIGCFTVGPLWC